MPDTSNCAALFEQLLVQIDGLSRQPRLSIEFTAWHEKFLAATEECFGPGSSELSVARLLQFEVPAEIIDSIIGVFSNPEELYQQQEKLGNSLDPKVKTGLLNLSRQPALWVETV